MIIQYAGQLFELTSMVEGLITPLMRGEDLTITNSDYLFDLERNNLYLSTICRAREGKILQFLVKPGDWVERNQAGIIVEREKKVEEWKFLKPGRILEVNLKVGDHVGFFYSPFTMMEKESGETNLPLADCKFIGISNENPKYRPDMAPQMYYFEDHNCGISTKEYYTEIYDIEWLVKEGQLVKKGDLLCSYQVPKLRLEFMSPYDGKIVWLRRDDSMFIGDSFFEIIVHQ
ncbi:predicted protein [Naegleria gruberi]|uniref:Predicted protein n=1 Tax=Naegleria gruberi TaxID=5762 RepID=D2W6B7_NAEGR|nr:uncharacterized protein NAEGRDRAFT_76960 [Naegleria gruberi]EFC35384.1 predicted protein [Naegleria gruberi]|eukprot:XP_002668128.1 predicted protein [Naegleria gruberi strain NEG-M]